MKDKSLIELGTCSKPHGIKGGFSFNLYNTEDSVLQNGKSVLLFPSDDSSSLPENGQEYIIEKINFGNKVITYLVGISDRNIVEDMIPFLIMFPKSNLPELNDGEFYIEDIIGFEAYDFKNDKCIGKIIDFYETKAQTVLVIKTDTKNVDIPFVDNFVKEIDLENKKAFVIMPIMVS